MNKVSKTYETTLSIPMCVTRDQKEKREKQRQKKRFEETMAKSFLTCERKWKSKVF